MPTSRPVRQTTREQREARVLDAAAELFYARGVHEVGMDELIRTTGMGKASVYRLFATKDELIAAYLRRLAERTLAAIDTEVARAPDAAAAIDAIFAAISADVARVEFRGCPFNNASIEFADPEHPARVVARDYRAALLARLQRIARGWVADDGGRLAAQLALIIDGMYVNGAHLGADGPAASGAALAHSLVAGARG